MTSLGIRSKFRQRLESGGIAALPVAAHGTQIACRLVVKIESKLLHQLAELRPRNNDLLRVALLVHDDLLLNCSHIPTISLPHSCNNGMFRPSSTWLRGRKQTLQPRAQPAKS